MTALDQIRIFFDLSSSDMSHVNLPINHSVTDMDLIPHEPQPTPSASRRKAREAVPHT